MNQIYYLANLLSSLSIKMKCAYCKEVGHHIRQCAKLEEKNNRYPKKIQQITVVIPCVSKPVLQKPHNVFADLYSSDDDIEDGEIVEDDLHSDCSSTEERSWSRSGIKGIYVPMPTNLSVLRSSIPEYVSMTEYNYETMAESTVESMAETFAYFETLRGRSWVDIEYDSDW